MPQLLLYQPYLNPIKFFKETPDVVPQYNSKHFDEHAFPDTIHPWEEAVHFHQDWQKNDSIRLQFQSNYAPLNLKLINADGIAVYDQNLVQVLQNKYDPSLYIYQADVALNAYDAGCYQLKLSAGSPIAVTLLSEEIKLSEKVENSILLEYKHRKYYADVFFETGFSPSIRIPGVMKPKAPGSIDTIYEDQESNLEMLKSVNYQPWNCSIGGPYGIPPWLVRKIGFILGCSDLKIDGRYYTKAEGQKLEENTIEFYPMSGWSIELREKLNRSSVIYENEYVADDSIAVAANVDSKGFAPNDAGGSVYQIEDIQ